jgi:DnaK suppressor protein
MIQYPSERDLAIRNVDRESTRRREVIAALRRTGDGTFGECVECGSPISPKRLTAVPWASRSIECQEADDRNGPVRELVREPLADGVFGR